MGSRLGSVNASEEEIRSGLEVLAKHGNCLRAAKELGIGESTLRAWRDGHQELFATLCEARDRARAESIASVASRFADDAEEARATLRQGLEGGGIDKLQLLAAKTILEAAVNIDRVQRLDAGKATERVVTQEVRSRDEIERDIELAALEAGYTVTATGLVKRGAQ